jgi:ribosomal RNA-processing protein 12
MMDILLNNFNLQLTAAEIMDSEESLTAVVYLLSIVIKRVPVSVLKKKFSEVAKYFINLLGTHSESDSTSLLKSVSITLCRVNAAIAISHFSQSCPHQKL